MTKLEIFNKLIDKAKSNEYRGPDYEFEVGRILDGTNYYSLVFREDFAKAVWGIESVRAQSSTDSNQMLIPKWKWALRYLVSSNDKWKFLEHSINKVGK